MDEDIYRSAWQASPLAIVTLDVRGRVRSCNPASEHLFGRTGHQLHERTLDTLAHPLDGGALRQMVTEALGGLRPARQEIRFQRPNDGVVVTGFSVAPTGPGNDGAVCILRDLSHEQAFRPQLLHTERMASIGMVASVVAHELNNALAGALGCLQLLPPHPDASAQELVESMGGELRRSAEIVRELKGYARVEDGISELVQLPELLARVQRLRRFHNASIKAPPIELEIEDELPPVMGNTNQLLQALLNLVRNAEQAVANLADERRVILIRATTSPAVVTIEVADHGPGVPTGLRGRLFEPFYSTKPAGDGTGLGLTVVQAVAAGHGGRVEIDQTSGGGATFRLVLPRHAASSEPAPPQPEPIPVEYSSLRGARVLVADDEPLLRRIVERACTAHGSIVTSAVDATTARQALNKREFDLAVLDVRMPGGGGARVFRTIREHHPQLTSRTIFMSGELSADMSDVVGMGYACILQKPFDLHDLLRALDRALTSPPKPRD